MHVRNSSGSSGVTKVAKIALVSWKGKRQRSEVAGGKLVVIVVAFHGEEMGAD